MRDDMRTCLGNLLPKYIALLADGERSDNYVLVEPVLATLESLGPVLEEHLPLLMPALVRLINPGLSSLAPPPCLLSPLLPAFSPPSSLPSPSPPHRCACVSKAASRTLAYRFFQKS